MPHHPAFGTGTSVSAGGLYTAVRRPRIRAASANAPHAGRGQWGYLAHPASGTPPVGAARVSSVSG